MARANDRANKLARALRAVATACQSTRLPAARASRLIAANQLHPQSIQTYGLIPVPGMGVRYGIVNDVARATQSGVSFIPNPNRRHRFLIATLGHLHE